MSMSEFEAPMLELREPEPEPAVEVLDAEEVLTAEVVGVESSMQEGRKTVESVALAQVSAFGEKLAAGETPRDAARSIGMTLGDLTGDPVTRELVQKLVTAFRLPAAVRREMVRAKLNEVLLTATKPAEVIAAAKAIGADPEVGLEGKGGNVSVNMSFDAPTQVALNVAAESKIPGLDE